VVLRAASLVLVLLAAFANSFDDASIQSLDMLDLELLQSETGIQLGGQISAASSKAEIPLPQPEVQAVSEDEMVTVVNKINENINLESPLSLSLAGQSGLETQCKVKGDAVTISGSGESACLFQSLLLEKRSVPVEIVFDIEFEHYAGDSGRSGGIFYGSKRNIDTREGYSTIDWQDRKEDHGYRVYGNIEGDTVSGLGEDLINPNSRWQIIIQPNGEASFTAGPKTWVQKFRPDLKGPYFGFWAGTGNKVKVTNARVLALDPKQEEDKANLKKEADNEFSILAAPGYGEQGGTSAALFYSASGGDEGKVATLSIYLKGAVSDIKDFRTESDVSRGGGSIESAENLVAARFLVLEDRNADSLDGTSSESRMFYVQDGGATAQEGGPKLVDRTLYVSEGNFAAERGSVVASDDIVAGQLLSLRAAKGFGTGRASFFYVNSGTIPGTTSAVLNTVFLKRGNFATERGSIRSSLDIQTSTFLSVRASPRFGEGSAKFWYSQGGKGKIDADTTYLRSGNIAAENGDVISARDIRARRHLKVGAMPTYGEGDTNIFFIHQGSGKLKSNTLYVDSSLSVQEGSVQASKNLKTGRYLQIGATEGFGTGHANLWYCHRATNSEDSRQKGLKDTSVYLREGEFSTQDGSIYAQNLVATEGLIIRSTVEYKVGDEAMLWFSKRGDNRLEGETLSLASGNFPTATGNIVASKNLIVDEYAAIGAMQGFGAPENKISLWYSAQVDESAGVAMSTLFQDKGDFRVESGSIHANDVSSGNSIFMKSQDQGESAMASFWYSDASSGLQDGFAAKSLYLSGTVDFRVNNIHASEDLVAKKNVFIHEDEVLGGSELWFGEPEGDGTSNGVPNTLYLRSGDFATKKGSIRSLVDIETQKGSLKIAPKEELRNDVKDGVQIDDYAELWFSGLPVDGKPSKALRLERADFSTVGNIGSQIDIRAGADGKLKSQRVNVKETFSCRKCHFANIYVMTNVQKSPVPAGAQLHELPLTNEESGTTQVMVPTEFISMAEGNTQHDLVDLGTAIKEMKKQHENLKSEERKLMGMLHQARSKLQALEN